MKSVILKNGVAVPQVGFGTYKAAEGGKGAILDAIECGYRHFDTASAYQNESLLGEAIRDSGIDRKEFFIASKLSRKCLGYESAIAEFESSLERLGMDYLDLYLIHWPRSGFNNDYRDIDRETWRAFEELYGRNLVRAIGVSNFLVHHLESLFATADIMPHVNQLELHPGYLQKETADYCRRIGIELEAWSPMGRGRLNDNPVLSSIARSHGISVSHLCLVFLSMEGCIVLPKSTHRDRMEENMKIDDVILSDEERRIIREMPEAGWSGEHPDRERVYF